MALSEYVRPVAYCEIDPYCQGVILSRQLDGLLHPAPIWDNIVTLTFGNSKTNIDIIYGGFPCQDISVAGKGKGLEGERSGLFFEIVRLSKEIKPTFIFLENVPAITNRGGLRVVREIAEMGYDCRWCVISAASVGALHRRERWFLLAHAKHDGAPSSEGRGSFRQEFETGKRQFQEDGRSLERAGCISSDVADNGNTDSQSGEQANPRSKSELQRWKSRRESSRQYWPFESRTHWQEVVSTICRIDDGVPNRVERLKSLGNAVVPIQVKEAFEILMGIK